MKFFTSFLFLVALCFLAPALEAQVTPRNVTALNLTATTAAANATTVITSQAFTIKPGSGFAVVPNFVLNGADTANITFNYAVSIDGVTWSTTTPFTHAEASTGTTPVIGFKNFTAGITGAGADNILYVRLASVTNASTTRVVTINSITVTRNN